uniref:Uncharacterized protein n=1 Tax=Sparus aurata TaxID=8175 RepID=A0A671XM57_SPAAU
NYEAYFGQGTKLTVFY